jgi:hypothetical protein
MQGEVCGVQGGAISLCKAPAARVPGSPCTWLVRVWCTVWLLNVDGIAAQEGRATLPTVCLLERTSVNPLTPRQAYGGGGYRCPDHLIREVLGDCQPGRPLYEGVRDGHVASMPARAASAGPLYTAALGCCVPGDRWVTPAMYGTRV